MIAVVLLVLRFLLQRFVPPRSQSHHDLEKQDPLASAPFLPRYSP